MFTVVYYSGPSENTARFVKKLPLTQEPIRIPLHWNPENPLLVDREYILCVPTYGGGNDNSTIPRQVIKFLNIEGNRNLLRGIVGLGNTNFGEHYARAADLIATKTGKPILARVEIFGTPEDVTKVTTRMEELWKTNSATTN
jgi:protein involved in ribonucleotide reduction